MGKPLAVELWCVYFVSNKLSFLYRGQSVNKYQGGPYPNDAFDSFEHEAEVWGEVYWPRVWWRRFKRWMSRSALGKRS